MKQVSEISPKTKLYQEVEPRLNDLLYSVVLVIDPSIGSSSSSPGWAVYNAATLDAAGTIDTGGSHLPLWKRARALADEIRGLCDDFAPTLLIYEDIPATSNFNANAQASLLKAVGIVLASSTTDDCLGIHPASWKNYVRPSYTKGDKEDAIEIGHVAVALAKHIATTRQTDGSRGTIPRRGNKGK